MVEQLNYTRFGRKRVQGVAASTTRNGLPSGVALFF
jgi:hypothetical protein